MPKKGRAFRPAPVNWVCTPSWFFFGAANYKRKFVINLWCYTKRLVFAQGCTLFMMRQMHALHGLHHTIISFKYKSNNLLSLTYQS